MPTPKFQPGQSGNPKGRPKDKTPATLLRKAIAGEMPEIVQKLVELAKGGDVQAAKVLLDRVCPPLKPQAMPVNVEKGATLPETRRNLVDATLNGSIPPDVGSMLIKALDEQNKLIIENPTIEDVHLHTENFTNRIIEELNQRRAAMEVIDAEH